MSVSEDTVSPAQALEQQTLEIGEGNSNSEVETEDSSSRLTLTLAISNISDDSVNIKQSVSKGSYLLLGSPSLDKDQTTDIRVQSAQAPEQKSSDEDNSPNDECSSTLTLTLQISNVSDDSVKIEKSIKKGSFLFLGTLPLGKDQNTTVSVQSKSNGKLKAKVKITKHGSSGKIVVKMSNKGHHFDMTKNNIHGLHGSLTTSGDYGYLTIANKSSTTDVCPGPAIVPYGGIHGQPLEIHVHVHVHTT